MEFAFLLVSSPRHSSVQIAFYRREMYNCTKTSPKGPIKNKFRKVTRINDPGSLGSWCIRVTNKSFPRVDLSLRSFENPETFSCSFRVIQFSIFRTNKSPALYDKQVEVLRPYEKLNQPSLTRRDLHAKFEVCANYK